MIGRGSQSLTCFTADEFSVEGLKEIWNPRA